MKRILVVIVAIGSVFCGFAGNGMEPVGSNDPVNDEMCLSWWDGAPSANRNRDLKGTVLGLGSGFKSVRGAQVSLCMNKVGELKAGAQVAVGYNRADVARNGCQVALVNSADSAALQFGLLCFNKGGFLPFFLLFNFDGDAFGRGK